MSVYGEAATSAQMTLSETGSRATVAEPADHFTGRAYIDPLFSPVAPQRAGAAYVTFVPLGYVGDSVKHFNPEFVRGCPGVKIHD